MKRILRKISIVMANIVVTVFGALWLVRFFDALPINMPYSVDMFLRLVLKISGNEDLANPDDMEIVALMLYLFVALIVVGCAVFAFNIALRRHLEKCRQQA